MGILRELHFEYDWSSSSSLCVHLVKIFRIVAHIPATNTHTHKKNINQNGLAGCCSSSYNLYE